MIGELIGGYRVVTELGAGPTGTVYYAEHPVIGRRAAIKVLAPELSDGPLLDRFLTHLKVASGIRHPNIVDVLDVGRMPDPAAPASSRELTFVVMEMLEGESLGERLERVEVLEEAAAVRLLVQIASALGAAHDRGLSHDTLKPENVFITNSADYPDFVKVLDFGATTLQSRPAESLSPYVAPELAAGSSPGPATDMYAVGVLGYHMLVGSPPWMRARDRARANEAPLPPMPPHERNPDVSKPLSDVIMRAIASDPDARWPGMRELRRALDKALLPVGQLVAPTPSLPQTALPVAGAEAQRTERVQAKKVGKTLSTIIMRRINENRLQLPSMPLVALKALDVLRDPNTTFADIARVIEPDPVIAARILRVVNSAAYSRRDPVTTLEKAISQIGVKPMRILLVELAACQVFTSRSAGIRQTFKQIWEHCLAVALLSRDLASGLVTRVDPDVAYLAGLMHDIGKPIVAGLLLEAERKLIDELDAPWMTESLWKKTVAESHRGVGATVATTWKLPAGIADAILGCDAYDQNQGPNACANIVRFANALAKREGIYAGEVGGDEIVAAILQGRSVLGVDEAMEARLIAAIRERAGSATGERSPRGRGTERSRRARVA
ncbi:MAG TPA: HDOD domain-containing protein [Polyangia bacterium]